MILGAWDFFLRLATGRALPEIKQCRRWNRLTPHERRMLGLILLGTIGFSFSELDVIGRRLTMRIKHESSPDCLGQLAKILKVCKIKPEWLFKVWRRTKVGSVQDQRFQTVFRAMRLKFPERTAKQHNKKLVKSRRARR